MSVQDTPHEDKVVVKLPHDQIVLGKRSNVKAEIEEFRGIPYGVVPARWQHARPREKLPSDIFDATSNGPRCCQPFGSNNTDGWQSHLDFPSDVTESEFDCLNLFISRPSQQALREAGLGSQVNQLPVYVYIHGGGYSFGAATDPMWDPARLVFRSVELKKPFIAVNINYRLNIFGFAASSDIMQSQSEDARGCNFALTDQRVALEWVAHNIAAFGGDSQRITVGGQSAGATSAHAHILDAKYSPDPPPITRGIIQSAAVGTLGPVPLAEAEKRWSRLCKNFGVVDLPPSERVAKLTSVSAQELLEVVKQEGWGTYPAIQDDLTLSKHESGDWKFSLKLNNYAISVSSRANTASTLDVLIGDTDVEGIVYRDIFVTRVKSSAQVQSAIMSSSASQSAKADIMKCYKFDADGDVTTVQNRVYSFATDMTFGLAVDRGWHKLSTAYSTSLGLNTTRQTKPIQYRVQFGNPWHGPNHDVAQHCVDLIYIYDCFHDDLRASDGEVVSRDGVDYASSDSLVKLLQSDWIDFITTKEIDKLNGASEEDLILYGRDRRRTVVPKSQDQEYQERQIRFEALEKHRVDANKIFDALRLI